MVFLNCWATWINVLPTKTITITGVFYPGRLDRNASYNIEKTYLSYIIRTHKYARVAFILGCETIRSLCCETYLLLVLNADYARVCMCVCIILQDGGYVWPWRGFIPDFFDQRRPQPIIKRRVVRTLFDCTSVIGQPHVLNNYTLRLLS